MRKISFLICILLSSSSLYSQYSEDYVETGISTINNERYGYIKMSRTGQRVKAKYFASKDNNNRTVYERYVEWARNKKIIAVSSGTYMTDWNIATAKPVGLCIDNGYPVNRSIESSKFDGLAIVYPSGGGGGIAVSNLKEGNVTVQDGSTPVTLNVRNQFDLNRFITWAERNTATVFQAHLFVYKNQILIKPDRASTNAAERRFLAVGTNSDGDILHYIVNLSGSNSIYAATEKVLRYLNKLEGINVTFMINLDTGGQNAFKVYRSNGSEDKSQDFVGTTPLQGAVNLLVYYFE